MNLKLPLSGAFSWDNNLKENILSMFFAICPIIIKKIETFIKYLKEAAIDPYHVLRKFLMAQEILTLER